jgi:hypothetical protein
VALDHATALTHGFDGRAYLHLDPRISTRPI